MAAQDNTGNLDFFINGAAWQRDLLAVKRAILDAEPVAAMDLLDELVSRLDPEPETAERV
jgi:hypothetical protein